MTSLEFDKEVEIARELFERVRNDGRDFHQTFRAEAGDGRVVVGMMDEETADARADALVALVFATKAKQVVLIADVWYRVIPKPSPAKAEWAKRTTLPPDGIMPSDDPNRKEALMVARFRPGQYDCTTVPYEMSAGRVAWGEAALGDDYLSNTFPRVSQALAAVKLGMP